MSEQPISFLQRLNGMDRRWIFLAMGLAVAVPIIWGPTFPEKPAAFVRGAYDTLQDAPPGSKVLVSFDFDPASAGELQPMATAVIHQCAERGHLIYCMTLWAPGSPLIDKTLNSVLAAYPGKYEYGKNKVNLGYQAGNEGIMKQVNTNFVKAFPNDNKGTPLSQIPMMKGIEKAGDFDILVSISAGYPGAKEWIQYTVSPTMTGDKPLKFIAGSTGVQTPQLVPYFPGQMKGVFGAIKGAAEYEYLVNSGVQKADGGKAILPVFQDAQRRMAPQMVAHVLMVCLIVLGNLIFFAARRKAARA